MDEDSFSEEDEEDEPKAGRSSDVAKATRAPVIQDSDEEDEEEYPDEEYEELVCQIFRMEDPPINID